MNREQILLGRIRRLTGLFIIGLLLSGATALPLQSELDWLVNLPVFRDGSTIITQWMMRAHDAVADTAIRHPFLFYGTDWLAFGHFVIAIAFVGAWRDPIRNRWLYDFGLIACALVVPYALLFGGLRGIPVWWRLIDCSFGVLGAIPLWFCRRWVGALERSAKTGGMTSRTGPG